MKDWYSTKECIEGLEFVRDKCSKNMFDNFTLDSILFRLREK